METRQAHDGATLPPGYSVRAASYDDVGAVAAARMAYQAAEGDPTVISADEQLSDWQGLDPAEDALVITAPDGSVVAHADVLNRAHILVSIYGGVHPDHTHQGLGTYLTRWGEDWTRAHVRLAPADAQIAVQHYVNARNDAARALMERLGYANLRTIAVMQIELDAAPPQPPQIEGIRIRPFVAGQDERATWEAHEDAFRDSWGRTPNTFERWLQITERDRSQNDTQMWYLAEDEDSGVVVGVCLARHIPESSGWIGTVGVRRPWRRRGVALALLRTAFAEYLRRGQHEVQLSVDMASPTDAPKLYSQAGMHPVQQILLYRKELRPGRDYTALATLSDV